MKRMLIVGATVIAFGLAGFAGSVEATKETPNGWCGALNMVVSAPGLGVHNENGVGVQPGGGMERGMTVDNPNGNAGMDTAAELSGGFQCLGIP